MGVSRFPRPPSTRVQTLQLQAHLAHKPTKTIPVFPWDCCAAPAFVAASSLAAAAAGWFGPLAYLHVYLHATSGAWAVGTTQSVLNLGSAT
jgi:hypothetical protein